jgi:hypothetical protein
MPRGIPNSRVTPDTKIDITAAAHAMRTLKRAIRRYVRAEIDHSWQGAQDPIYHDDIEAELGYAREHLDGIIYAICLDASVVIKSELVEPVHEAPKVKSMAKRRRKAKVIDLPGFSREA